MILNMALLRALLRYISGLKFKIIFVSLFMNDDEMMKSNSKIGKIGTGKIICNSCLYFTLRYVDHVTNGYKLIEKTPLLINFKFITCNNELSANCDYYLN